MNSSSVWALPVSARRDDIAARTGLRLEVARVAVRSLAKERPVQVPDGVLTLDAAGLVVDPRIDVVVEVIEGHDPLPRLLPPYEHGLFATDIQTGPNGNLFVVSLSQGAVYEIFRK
jgi:hypothetical protein